MVEAVTNQLDAPFTRALVEKFGAKLERLTAPDKLDIAHAILTATAWGDNQRTKKTVTETIEQFGTVMDAATQSEQVFAILDAYDPPSYDLLGFVGLLCLHLQMGVYADVE